MTVDDSDPDDRRDESGDDYDATDERDPVDDHDERAPADDATEDDDSTEVPVDESPSSDDASGDDSANDSDPADSRRTAGRDADDSRIGDAASGSDSTADDRGGHWLSSLLSALERLDDGSTSGRRRTDRTVVDYDISLRSGDDIVDESRRDRRSISGDAPGRDRRSESDSSRSRTRRRRSSSNAHHLTTRATEDELIVTADVASADPDEVTVGFDDSTLVVAVDGSELDRIDVPWRDRTAKATIKNGVLTVLIEPETDEGGNTTTGTGNDDE